MISRIEADNFLSFESIVIDDIEDKRLIGIFGQYENKPGYSNGVGKSALAEIIYFSITGNHRYKTDVEVIRIGENEARTFLLLKDTENKWELSIERFLKKRGKGTSAALSVKLNDELISDSVSSGQKFINSFLGITPQDFLNSYYFKQKEFQTFLENRSSDRIKFLQQFFEAYIFDEARKIISAQRRISQDELIKVTSQIEILGEKMKSNKNPEEIEEKIDLLKSDLRSFELSKKDIVKTIDMIVESISNYKDKMRENENNYEKSSELRRNIKDKEVTLERTNIDISKLSSELLDIESNIEKIDSGIEKGKILARKLWDEKKKERFSSLQDEVEALLINKSSLENNRQSKSKDIKNLEASNCPTCLREIGSSLRENLVKTIKSEIKSINNDIISCDDRILTCQNSIKDIKIAKSDYDKIKNEYVQLSVEFQKYESKRDLKKNIILDLTQKSSEVDTELKVLKRKLSEIKIEKVDSGAIEELNKEKLLVISERDRVDNEISVLNSRISKGELILKGVRESVSEYNNLNKRDKKLRETISDLSLLDELFEKSRLDLIYLGLKEVEEIANDIIMEIGATAKEIIFETFKENQKGDFQDSLEIYLTDTKGKREVSGLSGGELDDVSIAIRTGLSRYKLMRMNSKIDFMILDEIFGALDEISREEVIGVLNYFKNDFSQIFCISHTDLKKVFEHSILLEMNKREVTSVKEVN